MALVASIYDYYAANGASFWPTKVLDIAGGGEALFEGARRYLIGIMPWNYPYYQVARFVAPNLVLGNTVILKHARNCPQAALAIEGVLRDAGARGRIRQCICIKRSDRDDDRDPRVQGVSLRI